MQDVTTFYIPGLDVRTQYISKTENEDTLFFDPSASFSKDGNGATWMTPGKKDLRRQPGFDPITFTFGENSIKLWAGKV